MEREGVSALQQRAATRPFPFSVFLFQLPRLELRAAPAEGFRRDTMECGKSRDAEARKNVGRNFIEQSSPTAKGAGGSIIHRAGFGEKLRLRRPDFFQNSLRNTIEHFPDGLLIVMPNALRQCRNFSKNFRRKIAGADLIETPRQ